MPLTVLVIGEGAASVAARLARHDGLDPSPAGGVDVALAFLEATTFDVVLVRSNVAPALDAALAARGLQVAVHRLDDRSEDEWAQRLLAPQPSAGDGDLRGHLAGLQDEIADVVHALNNPLAVIVGNAQLAQELATSVDTDPTIVAAVDDIAHAGAELGVLFGRVRDLRTAIDRALRSF